MIVDPIAGGRISQLNIDGFDVLVARDADPMSWGCYPMVPFAGRIRKGRFRFGGHDYALPLNLPPHAIHGFGFTTAWEVIGPDTIAFDLAEPWPFPGRVEQRFRLTDSRLSVEMTLQAETRQPATLGWHPWFRRQIDAPNSLRLEFDAAQMFELDDEEIPTGELVEPSPRPWDNCFTGLRRGPTLEWGESLKVTMASNAANWVVFDQPADAICVEPQTGPPGSIGDADVVVEAGAVARAWMTLTWERPLRGNVAR
jgi:aldose 1-epimerase